MNHSRRLQRTCVILAVSQTPELVGTELSAEDLDKVTGGTPTIHFTTITKGKVETFLKYELENVGLSHVSVSSGGDLPAETISLNFTKVTETFSR